MLKCSVCADGFKLVGYTQRAWPLLPGYELKNCLSGGHVLVNGVRVKKDMPVFSGDEITIFAGEKYTLKPLKTVFDDGTMAALVKPTGLPVDADENGIGEDTVLARMRLLYPSASLVHRLDTGTGGIMLCALNEDGKKSLEAEFKNHTIKKTYITVTVGIPQREKDTLTAYILKNAAAGSVKVLDRPQRGALTAVTEYAIQNVITVDGIRLALLKVQIPTGRTHQIRAMLAHIGCPLLGDDKYGNREKNKRLKTASPLLWCEEIEFTDKSLVYAGKHFKAACPSWTVLGQQLIKDKTNGDK